MARTRSPAYDDQREMILAHAAELFSQRGYPATSMNQLAEACGLSKPTLYHYYRDKYALLVQIAEGHVARLSELVRGIEAEGLPAEPRLHRLIIRFVEEYAGAQHAHRVLTEDVCFLEPEDRAAATALNRALRAAHADGHDLRGATVHVTLEMMCAHGAAVVRGSYRAVVVVDLPFGSYEASPEKAFESAAYLLKQTGAAAVKLEGGRAMAPTVKFLSERGIPVMGHVGLTPQAVNTLGGYGARGRTQAEAAKIIDDGQAIAAAGAFALVIEGVVEPIAIELTRTIDCPTIGIGASAQCDGQVLVAEDMLGLFDRTARFVKKFDDLAGRISAAVETYAADVRSRAFPGAEQIYAPKD